MRIIFLLLLFLSPVSVFAECSIYDFQRHLVDRHPEYPVEKLEICKNGTYYYHSYRYGGEGSWRYIEDHVIEFSGPISSWGPAVRIEETELEFDYTNDKGKSVYSIMFIKGQNKCNPWPACY